MTDEQKAKLNLDGYLSTFTEPCNLPSHAYQIARLAYKIADAMMRVREVIDEGATDAS